MGNCQSAADVATHVVIQHPDGRVDKLQVATYNWSTQLTASQVMAHNPGHYVTVVVTARSKYSTTTTTSPKPPPPPPPVRYLKLLPPADALLVGHVYRLVTFEDVLREFGSKKHVRLSRLLAKQKEREAAAAARGRGEGQLIGEEENSNSTAVLLQVEEEQEKERGGEEEAQDHGIELDVMGSLGNNNGTLKRSQWRPSLHTIAEVGN